ncbi:MAG: hypothetical protein C0404_10045 [Verrucomicrobia bacterium]|nr:hypothetical protein [Verrucomicrobiota bacterium]
MTDKRHEELIGRYIDGIATDSERRELLSILRESGEARILLSRLLYHEKTMRGFFASTETTAPAELLEDAGGEGSSVSNSFRRWLVPLSLAASIFVLAGVWLFTMVGDNGHGGVVETGKGQTIALRFEGEDTVIDLAENTRLKVVGGSVVADAAPNRDLVRSGPGKVIELMFGSIKVSVAKQTENRSFKVLTSQAEMVVIGTKFMVSMGTDNTQTRLNVEEGMVGVRALKMEKFEEVAAGFMASVRNGENRVRHPGRILKKFDFDKMLKDVPYGLAGVAFDGKDVLVFMKSGVGGSSLPAICRIDGRNGDVLDRIQPVGMQPGRSCDTIAWDRGLVWGVSSNMIPVAIDTGDGSMARQLMPARDSRMALDWRCFDAADGFMWVLRRGAKDEICKIDQKNGTVIEVFKFQSPPWKTDRLAYSRGMLVLGEDHGARMCRVDLKTGLITAMFSMPVAVYGGDMALSGDGDVWITDWSRNTLYLVESD